MTSDTKKANYLIIFVAISLSLFILILFIFFYKKGYFSSPETLQDFIEGFGIWAPIAFITIQIIRSIAPVIPRGIISIGGILIFGNLWGFAYNYIGICGGSTIAFLLSKNFGNNFVIKIIGQRNYDKFTSYIENDDDKFDRIFFYAILSPISPADILCYIAGLTKMDLKRFLQIILLLKPVSIAIYILFTTIILNIIL